jgi:hypothetical protein
MRECAWHRSCCEHASMRGTANTQGDLTMKRRLLKLMTICALSTLGCAEDMGDQSGGTTEKVSDLYLTGTTWPGGMVPICFDIADGNNPTLVAEAQRVVTDEWTRAGSVFFFGKDAFGLSVRNPEACHPDLTGGGNYSIVALHFCGDSSNSPHCPVGAYDNEVVHGGAYGGLTEHQGPVPPTRIGSLFIPGFTHVSLISDDPDRFQTRFRHEVLRGFGLALGFGAEEQRLDNFNAMGRPLFCSDTDGSIPGTSETTYDPDSIMNACARDPMTGGFANTLSILDIVGLRNTYGPRSIQHGFMITSDRNSALAVNAFGGAAEGTVVKLSDACTIQNPDCTWSYRRGMLVSDRDPTLALNASGGAAEGTVLKLTRACTQSNPDCTWTYKNGEFVSDRDTTLAINAGGGAQNTTILVLTRACTASNLDCTWTMPHVLLQSNRDSTLAINAVNGAKDGTDLKLHNDCSVGNPDCTFTFTKGMLLSDTNLSLAAVAFGGANDGTTVKLSNACTSTNPDCRWTWKLGELISDNTSHGTLPINAVGGAVHLAPLRLAAACTAGNPDCVFSGLFAKYN